MNNTALQLKKSSFDEALEIRKFLRDEVFSLTFMAVVQRGKIYAPGTTKKDEFRRALRSVLDRMAEVYKVPITEEAHLQNIELLADRVSSSCGELLGESTMRCCSGVASPPSKGNRRFRIGSAQKALNLFLKYLWCLGEVREPPHCPFDRRIIERLPKGVQCNWTQCNDIEHYNRWVAAAREEAKKGSVSLAQWELCTFNT